MDTLRAEYSLKSTDLRKSLNISAATFNEAYKRAGVTFKNDAIRGSSKELEATQVRKVLENRGLVFPSPAQIIAIAITKGGTGKSSTAIFLSHRLAQYGARVLIIDTDHQSNTTEAFGLEKYGIEIDPETPVVRDVIKGDASIDEAIFAVTPTLHLLPSSPLNSRLDEAIQSESANPGLTFVDILRPIRNRYDFIIIDCAPALSLANQAIFNAADTVLMPVTLDRFAQSGLENTIEEIKKVQKGYRRNEAGEVIRPINYKILFNKFDAREYVSMRYYSEISEQYKDHLFNTVIKTSADVKTAQARRDDLFTYKKSSAREDFDALTKEILGWDAITNRKTQKNAEEA